jgi:hypothetical protein
VIAETKLGVRSVGRLSGNPFLMADPPHLPYQDSTLRDKRVHQNLGFTAEEFLADFPIDRLNQALGDSLVPFSRLLKG